MCVCAGACTCVYTCMKKPEVGDESLPQSLSTLFLEAEFCTKSGNCQFGLNA